MQKKWLYNVLFAQRKIPNWITSENNKKTFFFIRNYCPNCLESGIPSTIQGDGNDSDFLKWGSYMVESRVSTGGLDNSGSWFLFNPRGLLFFSRWSCFSLTMGMLWVVFEIIVAAAQTCPCCVNIYIHRLKRSILVLHAVHRSKTGEVSELTKYTLFWCRHRYLGAVIEAKGISLVSYHFHLRMPKAGYFLLWDIFWGNLKNCFVYRRNMHHFTFSIKY